MKLSDIRKITQSYPETNPAENMKLFQEQVMFSGNLYQELEMDHRFVDTHRDESTSNSVHLHSHSFYELVCCRNTCGVEYLMGAERYKLRKGDVIFVPPGISHCPLLPPDMSQPYSRDVIWLSEEFIRMAAELNGEAPAMELRKPALLRLPDQEDLICTMFRQGVLEAEAANPHWELAVAANTLSIFTRMCRADQTAKFQPLKAETPDLLDQVLSYIEQHMSQRITLSDTARHFFVSESTISQTFRKKMGISFYRCVTQRRLIAAKSLISQGVCLTSAAEQVGFSDYSSFFRTFKNEYGISPRQYSKLHQEDK